VNAQEFLNKTCKDFGREPMTLTRGQANKLRAYDWPGNVRELKNVIERAVILSRGNVLRLEASLPEAASGGSGAASDTLAADEFLTEQEMRAFQKKNTVAALKQAGWRVSGAGGAADLLGIKPTTLADRIRTLGIRKPVRGTRG
jgi:DNA-binding NtrC family response regulator